jgi:hypothetical protein
MSSIPGVGSVLRVSRRTGKGMMIRARMMDGRTEEPGGFRWRGREVSRLEALSDAVFGFAITLLAVTLEPHRLRDALDLSPVERYDTRKPAERGDRGGLGAAGRLRRGVGAVLGRPGVLGGGAGAVHPLRVLRPAPQARPGGTRPRVMPSVSVPVIPTKAPCRPHGRVGRAPNASGRWAVRWSEPLRERGGGSADPS